MRKIPVNKLKPGMRTGKPVYGTEGQLFLNRGVELKATYIKYLKKHQFNSVYIIDERMKDVEIKDVVTDQTRQESLKMIKKIISSGHKSTIAKSLSIYQDELKEKVQKIIKELINQENLIANLTDIGQQDFYTLNHSVNVCVLSLINGISLGYKGKDLRELGIGALVHDLGKMCVPHYILNKEASLTDEEFSLIKEHPRWGGEIIEGQEYLQNLNNVKTIVQQHHERVNGKGYPKGLKSDQISLLSKIVAVSDVYDALLADRPYRKSYRPHEAIELMYSTSEDFDAQIMQSFFNHVAAFPIGTMVKLNNNMIGLVIKNKVGLSLRPTVRIISPHRQGEPYQEIDLSEVLDMTIVDVLEEENTLDQTNY